MECMSNEAPRSYRLERVIAAILFLLFFLPFVANADEILFTDLFYGDEVKAKSAGTWLALTGTGDHCVLQPVKVVITNEFHPVADAEGEATGKRVRAVGITDEEGAYLLRSSRLTAGPVTCASPCSAELMPIGKAQTITFQAKKYVMRYQCASAPDPDGLVDCALVLQGEGITQVLAHFGAVDDRGKLVSMDVEQYVAFAGDLDRDGKLDLLANVSSHWNEWRPALFLSSAAKDGELVARVAELSTTLGC
jgi:hypothetical protein